jgi:hypothetical protein
LSHEQRKRSGTADVPSAVRQQLPRPANETYDAG